jgi:GntR family transcriptional repressor for pyruvate dehydrogenase complex
MRFKPIASVSRVDEVAAQLRKFVEKGQLAPGARLPGETELAEQFCISRNVLREAIKRLESIGLLSVKRGLGTFVGDRGTLSATTKLVRSAMAISPKDVSKVAELRRAIECEAVRSAAIKATAQDIEDLRTRYDKATQSPNLTESMEWDFKFHLKIVEIADNILMRNVMEVIQEFIYASIFQTSQANIGVPAAGDLHVDILEAIAAHDPERAEKAMRTHMDTVLSRLALAKRKAEVTEPAN